MSIWVHHIWNSLDLWDLDVYLLPQLRQVFSPYFLKIVFLAHPLSLFILGTLSCDCCPAWCPHCALRVSLIFFKEFFPWWSESPPLFFFYLSAPSLLLNPSSVFFNLVITSVLYRLFLGWSFTGFIYYSAKFSEQLYDHYFEFYQVDCLSHFFWFSFGGLVLFFWLKTSVFFIFA